MRVRHGRQGPFEAVRHGWHMGNEIGVALFRGDLKIPNVTNFGRDLAIHWFVALLIIIVLYCFLFEDWFAMACLLIAEKSEKC